MRGEEKREKDRLQAVTLSHLKKDLIAAIAAIACGLAWLIAALKR